ncbi:MAG TPA: flagellar hook protein FlgE [Candidatus Baltobacteraceae bacterium]|nr:flagellar hook protein FlgE [Candidatus Baltobacteraceae bacterium]
MGFDALFTGISGLNAYQSQIDMISNNIANVGTIGFKGQRMTFADLFYQSQGFASGPTQSNGGVNPMETGLGVKVNTIDTNFSQGGLQTTGINTDLALNGDGFFILRNTDGTGQPLYTRDGAFSLNSSGVLYDPATGLAVQGFMANSNGVVNASGTPGTVTIPLGLQMQATATGGPNSVKLGPSNDQVFDMGFGGSLDQTQYSVAANGGTPVNKVLTTTIYDSLGNAHQATITFSPSAPVAPATLPATVNNTSGTAVAPATRWTYSVSFADGTTMPAGDNTGYVWFDTNGQFINSSGDAAGANVHTQGNAPTPSTGAGTGQGDAIQISGWPAGNNSTAPQTIGLDFSNMSALSGTATANVLAQNGYAAGTLSNITVGQDGTITGSFTNGQQKTIAEVAVATFQNEGGLHRTGGNGFVQTANSGLAQVGTANSGRYGAIVSGSLEQSNVSLADEFTKMIVAQRAFEANTRGISTADQNLMTVLNIRGSEN